MTSESVPTTREGCSVHFTSMGMSRPPRAMMESTSAPALERR